MIKFIMVLCLSMSFISCQKNSRPRSESSQLINNPYTVSHWAAGFTHLYDNQFPFVIDRISESNNQNPIIPNLRVGDSIQISM